MSHTLEAFEIEGLPADIDRPSELPDQHLSELPSEQTHRNRVRAAGLGTSRVEGWTRMTCERLWREWLRPFGGDADRALDALIRAADRLAPERSPGQQETLRRLKRALLGDAYSEAEYPEPMGPEERRRLPLPFKAIVKALKHVAGKRAGFRPWDTGS